MLLDRDSGDHTCFTCGHIVYRQPPIDLDVTMKRVRHPTHGGRSLV
jgi:hypothetical protein